MLLKVVLSILGLVPGICLAEANDSKLVREIDTYLADGETAGDEFYIRESGKIFVEYLIADTPARYAGIRRLHEAYARPGDLKAKLIPYAVLHRLPISLDELSLAISDKLFEGNRDLTAIWARVLSDRLGSESLSGYVELRNMEQAVSGFPDSAESVPIVRFLFQKSPSSALLLLARTLVRGEEEKKLLINDRHITSYLLECKYDPGGRHETGKIQDILKLMSTSQHSWVRLYVVEMMIQNPILRDEALLKDLRTDRDELVALAIKDLEDPKKQIRHRKIRTPWQP